MGCFPNRKSDMLQKSHSIVKDVPKPRQTEKVQSIANGKGAANDKFVRMSKIDSENIKITNLIARVDTRVTENYKILNHLGKGSFGSVYKVKNLDNGIIRAMKVIKKDCVKYQDDNQTFMKEIEILMKVEHPNIIKIYEYYIDDVNYYLITEYVSGGELYETISSWRVFDEDKAIYIMSQILSAVNYLHKQKIVHRDIKPENMLVEKKMKIKNEDYLSIKLIDFGTCNYITEDKLFTLKVGSPYYIAPEVLKKEYNEKCDIWSCGVLLYILLVGYPPFRGKNTVELLDNIQSGKYSIQGNQWDKVSADAKDLLKKMLEYDKDKRISAEDAMQHNWMMNAGKLKVNQVDPGYFDNVIKNIVDFNLRENLQKATVAYIVHSLYSSNEIEELKNVFKMLDKNSDGILSYVELKTGFEKVVGKFISEVEMDKIIQEMDGDNNGFVSYEEFLRVSIDQKNLLSERNLKLAFERFDSDKNGKLSVDEIKKVLGIRENEYIRQLLNVIDANGDGCLGYDEFKDLMNKIIFDKKDTDKSPSNNVESKLDDIKKPDSDEMKMADQQNVFEEHRSSSESSLND